MDLIIEMVLIGMTVIEDIREVKKEEDVCKISNGLEKFIFPINIDDLYGF